MAEIMRKTIISNKLIHKPQGMQGCAKKIIKKKRIIRKNNCPLKYFTVKGSTLEDCRRTMTIQIQPIFITWTDYTIKVIVLY